MFDHITVTEMKLCKLLVPHYEKLPLKFKRKVCAMSVNIIHFYGTNLTLLQRFIPVSVGYFGVFFACSKTFKEMIESTSKINKLQRCSVNICSHFNHHHYRPPEVQDPVLYSEREPEVQVELGLSRWGRCFVSPHHAVQ